MHLDSLGYSSLHQPKALPTKSFLPDKEKKEVPNRVLAKHSTDFSATKRTDPDFAWRKFAVIAEEYLRGIHVNNDSQGEGGRHGPVRFTNELRTGSCI